VAVRQRAQRRGAGAVYHVAHRLYYLRNNAGPAADRSCDGPAAAVHHVHRCGIRSPADFTVGISNSFKYKRASLDFLVDVRRGGDVFNATQHYLTQRGLSTMTLDRDTPRVNRRRPA
jgi:hypothetical protein